MTWTSIFYSATIKEYFGTLVTLHAALNIRILKSSLYIKSEILMDKTMDDTVIYKSNYNKQNHNFCIRIDDSINLTLLI